MPELPEVQTTVDGLNATVRGKNIKDVWTDLAVARPSRAHHLLTTKSKSYFAGFKKAVIGKKILRAERRAKNILIHLSGGYTILIHMKMTGHMMYGAYRFDTKSKEWAPSEKEKNAALRDPFNKFLHTVFTLSDGKQLVLSDMRKFATVAYIKTADIGKEIRFENLGPEPLDKNFTEKKFSARMMRRPSRPVKEVLLDQSIVSGIGNIYSDEMLWLAGIHPLRAVRDIKPAEMKKLHAGMKTVLKKGIDFGGDSTSDYRDIRGRRGKFQAAHNAYRMTGKPCRKPGCGGTIVRIPFMGRGAHFCDRHQK